MDIKKLFELLTKEQKEELMAHCKEAKKDDIHFQPEYEEEFWFIDDSVEASLSTNDGDCDFLSKDLILYGNCCKTREEALARVELRKHVVAMNLKYGRHGSKCYKFSQGKWQQWGVMGKYSLECEARYHNELFIHFNSEVSEQEERLRLIQAVYGGE